MYSWAYEKLKKFPTSRKEKEKKQKHQKPDAEAKSQTGTAVIPALGVLANLSNQETFNLNEARGRRRIRCLRSQNRDYSLEALPNRPGS